MKTIVAMSRGALNQKDFAEMMKKVPWPISRVLTQMPFAVGYSKPLTWAKENHTEYKLYPANRQKFGSHANNMRNIDMVNDAEALVVFWDGESLPLKHLIRAAARKQLKAYIVKIVESATGRCLLTEYDSGPLCMRRDEVTE